MFGVAGLCMAFLHCVCLSLYINLTYSIWPALAGGSVYAYRVFVLGARATTLETALGALSFSSNPMAIVSAPVIMTSLVVNRGRGKRVLASATVLGLGIALGVLPAIGHNGFGTPDDYWAASLRFVSHLFGDGVISALRMDFPLMLMLTSVGLTAYDLLQMLRGRSSSLAVKRMMATYFIVGFAAVYFASNRFVEYGYVADRYLVPGLAFAILVLASVPSIRDWINQALRNPVLRSVPARAFLGITALASVAWSAALFASFYQPRLAFLAAAQCVRDHALPATAIMPEPDRRAGQPHHWRLVVLGIPSPYGPASGEIRRLRAGADDPELAASGMPDGDEIPNRSGDRGPYLLGRSCSPHYRSGFLRRVFQLAPVKYFWAPLRRADRSQAASRIPRTVTVPQSWRSRLRSAETCWR